MLAKSGRPRLTRTAPRPLPKREGSRLSHRDPASEGRGEFLSQPPQVPPLPLPDPRGALRRLPRPVASSATTWAWARRSDAGGRRTAGPGARHRARAGRRAGVGQVPVGDGDPQVHRPAGAGDRRHDRAAAGAVQPADVLSPHQLRDGDPRPRRAQRLAARPDRARRGAAHQELGVEDVAGGQEAAQPLRPGADRHAAGEQARGAVQHRAVRGRPPARAGVPVPARPPRRGREGQAARAIATSTRSARSWPRSCCAARGPRCSAQLPARTDSTVFVEMAEPDGALRRAAAGARPAARKEVPDRGGPPAHPVLPRQPADALRQHVPVRQADERLAEAGRVRRAAARAARRPGRTRWSSSASGR